MLKACTLVKRLRCDNRYLKTALTSLMPENPVRSVQMHTHRYNDTQQSSTSLLDYISRILHTILEIIKTVHLVFYSASGTNNN